jgi:hypothetical protein
MSANRQLTQTQNRTYFAAVDVSTASRNVRAICDRSSFSASICLRHVSVCCCETEVCPSSVKRERSVSRSSMSDPSLPNRRRTFTDSLLRSSPRNRSLQPKGINETTLTTNYKNVSTHQLRNAFRVCCECDNASSYAAVHAPAMWRQCWSTKPHTRPLRSCNNGHPLYRVYV